MHKSMNKYTYLYEEQSEGNDKKLDLDKFQMEDKKSQNKKKPS